MLKGPLITRIHHLYTAGLNPQQACHLIVWLPVCTQITAKVTELIICELLWLNYSNPESPLNIYVHSIGTQTQYHQVGSVFSHDVHFSVLCHISQSLHVVV